MTESASKNNCPEEMQSAIAASKIADVLKVVADMAAGAAHEINNPLAVISGRAQLMREQATTEEDQKVWDMIASQSQRISDIISDLMEFASPEPVEQEKVKIGKIVENALFYFSSLNNLNGKAPKIDKDIEKGLPLVWADRTQAEAVVQELILNAAAAETECNIYIKARAVSGGEHVHLTVRDDGPGMEAETLASAFTPFFSAQLAGRRRGLGLPMAWRYVVNNHGRIWIESQPGQGTTVHVVLRSALS